MGKVRNLANKLEKYDIMKELDIILYDLSNVITGMNKEQLSIGQDVDGNLLSPLADPYYALNKKDNGGLAPLGIPDLKVTGDFYNGFVIIISGNIITITSRDIKTLQLEGKYGDIFGLQDNNLSELAFNYILPRLVKSFKTKVLS